MSINRIRYIMNTLSIDIESDCPDTIQIYYDMGLKIIYSYLDSLTPESTSLYYESA